MNILTKKAYFKLNERFSVKKGDKIFIHHPITKDVITVNIEEKEYGKILVSIPEDSDYYGQPNFYVKTIHIIGKS